MLWKVLIAMSNETDVHIVQAAAVRREWERQQAEEVAESRARYRAEVVSRDVVEAAAVEVRVELTRRLGGLLDSLEPYVDGTMGEVTVGLASVYVKACDELGKLYGLTRPPRKLTAPLPLPEPPLVVDPSLEVEQRAAAAAVLRAEGLRQLEARRRKLELEGR